MENVRYEALKRMRALAAGAIQFFEIEGDETLRLLRKNPRPGLVSGLETIGAALYALREQIEEELKRVEAAPKA